jgi:hypothetical protein
MILLQKLAASSARCNQSNTRSRISLLVLNFPGIVKRFQIEIWFSASQIFVQNTALQTWMPRTIGRITAATPRFKEQGWRMQTWSLQMLRLTNFMRFALACMGRRIRLVQERVSRAGTWTKFDFSNLAPLIASQIYSTCVRVNFKDFYGTRRNTCSTLVLRKIVDNVIPSHLCHFRRATWKLHSKHLIGP